MDFAVPLLGLAVGIVLVSIVVQWLKLPPEARTGDVDRLTSSGEAKLREPKAARSDREGSRKHGPRNAMLVCPHCQAKGSVRTLLAERKAGISGTKAAGAVLFGPISLLLAGLSRKEQATHAHCDACGSTWTF